uniref:sister chromatid cohesion 1 protein 2-like isoform X2 n=1 Tax=Erigeron canadensis TaxID=72917 RepID=UPI001CB9B157|nr:sister chromatid cohesion 1 protein 2-like isoform X2 [Erigeron canadensis]
MVIHKQLSMGKKSKELENVWMAAHFPKRIKKELVHYTNIISSVDNILVDQISVVTYRILGFLLLGVARIYAKKVEYLLVDSNRSMNEIQLYFEGRRKDTVNVTGMCLPESSGHRSKQNTVDVPVSEFSSKKKSNTFIEAMRAQFSSISMPETFELDAFDLEIVEDDSSNDHVRPHLELVLNDAWENVQTRHHNYGKHGDAYARFSDHASTSTSAMATNFNPSNSEKSAEKFRHRFSLEECLDPMVLDETDDEDVPVKPFIEQEPECTNINIPDIIFEDGETSHMHPVEDSTTGQTVVLELTSADNIILKPSPDKCQVSVTIDVTPQSKAPVVLGEHKSDCVAVRTPAPMNEVRLPRKRKCVFDEPRKIPNDVYRDWLEDASDLVCKRRITSSLHAWKQRRSTDYFLEPIVAISADFPSDLRSVISTKELVLEEVEETREPDPKVTELMPLNMNKVSEEREETIAPSTPLNMNKVSEEREEETIAPSTPVTRSTSLRFHEVHAKSLASQAGPASSSETVERDYRRVVGVDMDEVQLEEGPSALGESNQENFLTAEKWSAVTKSIARRMHGYFVCLKERGEEGALKLSQILKQKTKKESARFFYQILVLKTGGYVDVKQAKPYDEIHVMQTPKLEEVFVARGRK